MHNWEKCIGTRPGPLFVRLRCYLVNGTLILTRLKIDLAASALILQRDSFEKSEAEKKRRCAVRCDQARLQKKKTSEIRAKRRTRKYPLAWTWLKARRKKSWI